MNEPNKTYSFDDIKEILGGKDKRTVQSHIAAAGYKKKDSYSEEEVAWIREVQSIKETQSNISYGDVTTEIERRKAEVQRQRLLGGSPSAPTPSNQETDNNSAADSQGVSAQPPVDTDFIGGLVKNIVKEQVATHMVRCVHQLPTMMNEALEDNLPELRAAADIALQQNRQRLEPMRRIETVETAEPHLLEGETVEVESSSSSEGDEQDSGN